LWIDSGHFKKIVMSNVGPIAPAAVPVIAGELGDVGNQVFQGCSCWIEFGERDGFEGIVIAHDQLRSIPVRGPTIFGKEFFETNDRVGMKQKEPMEMRHCHRSRDRRIARILRIKMDLKEWKIF